MVKLLEALGERMLSKVAPSATAYAVYCDTCGPAYQKCLSDHYLYWVQDCYSARIEGCRLYQNVLGGAVACC